MEVNVMEIRRRMCGLGVARFHLLILIYSFFGHADALSRNHIIPDNTFSAGEISYNNLIVDSRSTSLYVGAHGNLFRLWLYNINDTASPNLFAKRTLEVRAEERDECLRMGNTEVECENRVRLIFLKNNGHIFLCSSSGMKPQLSTLDGSTLTDVESPRTIIGICSPHEALNTTAVYSESGNPDDLAAVYSGIRTGLSLENHLIYRPPLVFNNKEVHSALRTIYTDSKWLNEPQFVGSFSVNQYVYFFFREVAIEAENCGVGGGGLGSGIGNGVGGGQIVYSRVARICKNDLGGKNVLRQVWTSFVKARLNCSVVTSSSSAFPFYFDHIQSVFKLDEELDSHFYATFTTPESPFQASAICVYSLNAINLLFDNGIFLEQPSITSAWIPTQPDRIPLNRPGACSSDSRQLSDEDLHFAKSHLLMADAISGGPPIIYRQGELLTKIVADRRDERRAVLFALSPHRHQLLKIRHLRGAPGTAAGRGRLLAAYRLAENSGFVNDMALLPGEYLYLAEASRVSQFRLGQCALHAACAWCAADPYCAWNLARGACFAREPVHSTAVGWITTSSASEGDEAEEKCRNYVRAQAFTLYPGDALRLECAREVGALENDYISTNGAEEHGRTSWRVDRRDIPANNMHIVHTVDGGIVLLNVSNVHSGTYQCLIQNTPLVEYTVTVDDADCARPKSVEQFRSAQREWCKKYDSYKSNLSRWQSWYEKNNNHCSTRESPESSLIDQNSNFS